MTQLLYCKVVGKGDTNCPHPTSPSPPIDITDTSPVYFNIVYLRPNKNKHDSTE